MSKNIIIIDDDPVVRLLLSECLKATGFNVEAHESGKTGIPSAQNDETKPDLIFVDLMMPDMTGFEVISQLKQNPVTAKVPIVLLSAIADQRATKSQSEHKPDRFLEKPWDMPKLLATISELIGS